MFQRKRYYFSVARDKKLVNSFNLALDPLKWKFFARKWNNNSRFYI
jgi:hypothetical protein